MRSTRSGFQSPMLKSCEITREPGFNWRMIAARRRRLAPGYRYIVTTLAGDRSTVRTSSSRISASASTPASWILRCESCHQCMVDLKTDGLGPISLGRCNHNSSVARSEIIENVLLVDLSQLQHPIDHFLGCGHEGCDICRVAVLFLRISESTRIIDSRSQIPCCQLLGRLWRPRTRLDTIVSSDCLLSYRLEFHYELQTGPIALPLN